LPPRNCIAFSVTRTALSPVTSLDIDPSAPVNCWPLRAIQAARQTSSRAASMEVFSPLEGRHRRLRAAGLSALAGAGEPLLELLAAAEQALARDPAVLQHDLGGVRGADAVLEELLTLGDALRPRRDDEAGVPAGLELGVDDGVDRGCPTSAARSGPR
jgi:hypothetical protein